MVENKKELLSICIYGVCAASELKNEPREYGSLRLLEIVERILDYTIHSEDESLIAIREKIRQKQDQAMTDPEAFYDNMSKIMLELVKERKKAVKG